MSSLKIKTITCHDVDNYGATLQAYALVNYLKSLGHEAEVIDYKPEYLDHYSFFKNVSKKYDKPFIRTLYYIVKIPGKISPSFLIRKRKFKQFLSKYVPRTKTYHTYNDLLHDKPHADVFIAGSDQIWNTYFQNGSDPAFYLSFAPKESVRASYAASIASSDIQEQLVSQVREWVDQLDFVSVREDSAVELLKTIGISNVYSVCDPVFLKDADSWTEMCDTLPVNNRYILSYGFGSNSVFEERLSSFARENNLKVYSLTAISKCDKTFRKYGPTEFLTLIKNAELVVTNSFHAIAFSIIFHKKFFAYYRAENLNSRIHDLLFNLGLEERLLNADTIFDLSKEIDYESVDTLLKRKVDSSKSYIDKVLAGVKEK